MKFLSAFSDLIGSKEAVVALGGLWVAVACVSISALLLMSLG